MSPRDRSTADQHGRSSPAAPEVPAWVVRVSTISWAFIGAVVASALVVAGLGVVRELVIPVVLSAFLAVVFSPIVGWLAARRVPRAFGALLVLLLIAAIAALSVGAIAVGIVDQSDKLSQRFDEVVARVEDLLDRSDVGTFVDTLLNSAEGSGSILRDGFGSAVGSALGTASGFFSGLVIAAVVLYYLLKDGPTLVGGLVQGRGATVGGQIERVLAHAADSIRAYVKGRTVLALVQGIVIGVVAAVAGVPLAFAIAIVNIFGAYVPYIGGFVGGAFAVLMALSEGGVGLAVLMLTVTLAVSIGLENLLEPVMLGDRLDLHPIVVLLATVIGGVLVGIVGMFLAAPAVAIGRSFFRELVDSGFFASGEPRAAERPPGPGP